MTATLEITPGDALRSIKRKGTDIIAGVEIHPAASLFPMLDDRAFAELKADIDKHGQREPIVYWRGQLLDGRNRLRACRELKIQPSDCELDEGDDPIAFVLSANLHRRHLTTAQRALVAVEVKKLLEPEAKERKTANLKKGKQKPEVANLPPREKTRDRAGELLKVSGRTVDKAEKILASGSPELVAQVVAGEVSIDKASKAVSTSPASAANASCPESENIAGHSGLGPDLLDVAPTLNDHQKHEWTKIVKRRRNYIKHISGEMAEVVRFTVDGLKLWQELDYTSFDSFVERGLGISLWDVKAALEWLDRNDQTGEFINRDCIRQILTIAEGGSGDD